MFKICAFDALFKGGKRYDAIVVDEGQDFRDEWWEVVQAALKEAEKGILYIFHDDQQALLPYRSKYPIDDPLIDLSRNCRNAGTVYELMRHLNPQAPMTEPELKDEGGVQIVSYLPGTEKEAIKRAVRWMHASGCGNEFVFLLGGSQSVEDFPLAGQSIEVRMLKSWQEDIRSYFEFDEAAPGPDLQGVKLPAEGMALIRKRLARLRWEPTPNQDDINLVIHTARLFNLNRQSRLKAQGSEYMHSRWVVKDERLQLLRSDSTQPSAAEILMHLESGSWADVIPEPLIVDLKPYDAPDDDGDDYRHGMSAFLRRRRLKRMVGRMYNVADFKGLEADVVLLLARGGLPMSEQQLYVGISRARFVLAVLVDRGILPLLKNARWR